MATSSWAFSADHQNDAGFRAWVADFITHLGTVGLTQTADTGQINTATVTRPGTNSDGGFATFHDNDTLHGSAPIYYRFNFGTDAVAARPRIQVIVGTSTNGSGTVGGTALTGTLACSAATGTATGSSFQNYMCKNDYGFWFSWQVGSPAAALAFAYFAIGRTCDAAGVATVTGAHIQYPNAATAAGGTGSNQSLRFAASAAVYTATTNPAAMIPGPDQATLVGANTQVFPFWGWSPAVYPVIAMGIVRTAETAELATFTATIFGSTSHTYINSGRQGAQGWTAATATNWGRAMIWE